MDLNDEIWLKRQAAIFRIRAEVLRSLRSWFDGSGFVEVAGPVIVPRFEEQAGFFEVDYFGEKACLGDGLQPYSDVFLDLFDKVYSVGPAFRAEGVDDGRHLSEFWRVEVASSVFGLKELLIFEEGLLRCVFQAMSKMGMELGVLGCSPEQLQRFDSSFPRVSYDDAVVLLQKKGKRIVWGEELDWECEKVLSESFSVPFFVTEFPLGAERFLFESNPKVPELTLSADLLAPQGYGELSSGGQLVSSKKVLRRRLVQMGLSDGGRRWYLSFRRKKVVHQSIFALGLERLVWWMCGLERISDVSGFSRVGKKVQF